MFEPGKKYQFLLGIGEDRYETVYTVESFEYPLLKMADRDVPSHEYFGAGRFVPGPIINVTSSYFNKATLVVDKAKT